MALRDYIILYINGKEHNVYGKEAFMPLANYLRYRKQLTGTKIVCAEGDCGACTVLCARQLANEKKLAFKAINSCISAVYLLDGCHLITVEGLKDGTEYHVVQKVMIDNHGAQCGYCTPGFICSLAQLSDDVAQTGKTISEQKAKNYLTGNLCRCTGYKPIIMAATQLKPDNSKSLLSRFVDSEKINTVSEALLKSVLIEYQDRKVFIPTQLEQVDQFIHDHPNAKINSGGTDLGVLINKCKVDLKQVVSLNNISSLYDLKETSDTFEIGCRVSLESTEKVLQKTFPEFARMIHIFASPQIKNTATLVGNIANGSPIGDTLPFLIVADTKLVIRGQNRIRHVNLNDFYLGYKKLDLLEMEYIEKIIIPKSKDLFKLYKVSLRKDLDISAVTFAGRISLENNKISNIKIAFGGVGPIVKRLAEIENALTDQLWSQALFKGTHAIIENTVKPLSDVRGSNGFRLQVCKNLMMKFYDDISKEHFNQMQEASI